MATLEHPLGQGTLFCFLSKEVTQDEGDTHRHFPTSLLRKQAQRGPGLTLRMQYLLRFSL